MTARAERAAAFLAFHAEDPPLMPPNCWDGGSAKLFAAIGFRALATTSSGCAATYGRLDGEVAPGDVLAHCAAIAGFTSLPVSADLENGFADDPAGVAATIGAARDAGLAGCSIEDFTGRRDDPIYDIELATERIAAAAEAAHAGGDLVVLTARAESHLHGRDDLGDTIERLQRYQAAGADVLYAPGLTDLGEIRTLVRSALILEFSSATIALD
jgi:2-methylisocitrate lyase-like PEP mutase family enzyme